MYEYKVERKKFLFEDCTKIGGLKVLGQYFSEQAEDGWELFKIHGDNIMDGIFIFRRVNDCKSHHKTY